MPDKITLNFSHVFEGAVWNVIAGVEGNSLIIEVRDASKKTVMFSGLDLGTRAFDWKDRLLDEPWWVNATAFAGGIVLFTVYLETNNPDKKGVLAYRYRDLELVWWNNDFSPGEITDFGVRGTSGKFGLKEIILDLHSGTEVVPPVPPSAVGIPGLKKPVQYTEGMNYFDTVRTFLSKKLNLDAVSALEYLETPDAIFISFHRKKDNSENQLANDLLVLYRDGSIALHETIDTQSKGIGLDTFFVLNDAFFFVRNKTELVSYSIL